MPRCSVKVAVHEPTGVEVAVKVMNKDDIRNKDLTVSVRREVAIMKALRHKNIVSLHRVLSSSTRLYVIMDLVYGSNLEHHIAEAERAGMSLTEDKVRTYFRHIVDGVVHCHERRVYHRDLKPQNILLRSEDDQIFITDFGVSGIKGVDSTTDLLTTQCGTPTYIAPEIISHAGAGYSGEKVDCWALGVILFFMLSGGKLPFDDDRLEMLFDKIQTSAVEYPERISADAVDLLEKLLTKSPTQRLSAKQIRSHHWYRARSVRRKRRTGERRGSGNLGSSGGAPSSAFGSMASSATPTRTAPPPPAPTLRLSFAEKKETEEAIGQLQLLIARSSRYISAAEPAGKPSATAATASPSASSSMATGGPAAVGADYLDSLFSADGTSEDPPTAAAAASQIRDASVATGGRAAVGVDYLDSLFDDDEGLTPPTPMQRQLQIGAPQASSSDAPPATGTAAATQRELGPPSSQFQSLLRLCDPSPTQASPSTELRDSHPCDDAVANTSAAAGAGGSTGSDRPGVVAAEVQPPLRRVATQRALARVRASVFSLTAEDPCEEPDGATPTVAPQRPLVHGAPTAPSELVIAARQALDAWEKAMGGDGADVNTTVPVSDQQLGALKQLLDLWKHPATPLQLSPVESTGGRHPNRSDSSSSPSASSPSSVCTTTTTPAMESLPGHSPPVEHGSSSPGSTPRSDHKGLNEEWGRVLNANPSGVRPSGGLSDLGRRPPDRGPIGLGSGCGDVPSQRAHPTLYSSSGVRVTQVDDTALDAVGEAGSTASAVGSLGHVEGISRSTLPRTSSSVAALAAAERVTAAERIAKQVRQQERALAALSLSDDEITEVSPDKAGDELFDGVSAVSLSLPSASSRPPVLPHAPHVGTSSIPLSDQGPCPPVIVTTSSVFFRGDALPAEAGAGSPSQEAATSPVEHGRGGGAAGTPAAVSRGTPPPTRLAVTKSVVRDPARFDADDEPASPVTATALPTSAPSVASGGPVASSVSGNAADTVGTVALRGRLMHRSDAGADRAPLTFVPGTSTSCDSVMPQRQRPGVAAPSTQVLGGTAGTHGEAEGSSILSSLLPSRVVRHGQSESHDSSFSWARLVGGSRDGGGRSQLGAGAVAAPTALAVKGLKRLGFAPRTGAEPCAAAAAGAMGVSVGNSSGLVFESAMSRDKCMTTVGRLLVDDLFCDVLSRTDGGHSKLRCSLPNQKNEWPIKIYFEPIDKEGTNAGGSGGGSGGGGASSGSSARRSKVPSPRLAQTVVVMSKGRASDLTPAQLRGFYDQVLAKFRASSPDAVVSPLPSFKPWR
ncbi:hypothetical protein MMPV_005822 [Pyropia vietnamensis]